MFTIFKEEKVITAGILVFLCLSVLVRLMLAWMYHTMIRETDNMATTGNRLLKQCKVKFANCYQLNGGVSNIPVFVDKFLNRLSFGHLSFDAWYHLSGQCMLFSVIFAGMGICKGILDGRMLGEILPFYIASFLGLYLYFSLSALVDIKGKRRVLKTNLIDYLSVSAGEPLVQVNGENTENTIFNLEQSLQKAQKELEEAEKLFRQAGLGLRAVYVGGGTPTALAEPDFARLMNRVMELFSNAREYTVEAGRPDTITRGKLETLKGLGVRRISINPQTMNDETLRRIGRDHTSAQTEETFLLARELGFEDINMDVITGLPGEEMPQFEHTMDEIRRLAPDSLTVHTLAIKRSSRLNLEKYPLPDGDLTARMVRLGGETARALGMKPYYLYRQKYMAGQQQNVGYATAGNACLYNIDMMEETGSVIAVGAGAISKRVFPDRELRIERAPNVTNVAVYIDRVAEMARRKEHLFHS